MKKIYTLPILFSFMLLFGCSKDFLKRYDTRIIGTWRVADVNRIGFGANPNKVPFNSGIFTFNDDGSLTYISDANVSYEGKWEILKKVIQDKTVHGLQISAVDFTTQEILSEYYDDMSFLGTNHFSAESNSTFATYVTHFRR